MERARNNFRKKIRQFRYLTLSLLGVLLLGVLLLFFGDMDDSVRGRGIFEGLHQYQMRSSVRSRICEVAKEDGDKVKKGDVLLKLDDRDLREKIALLENAVRELQAEIQVKTDSLAVLRRDPLPKEYRHTAISLAEYKMRLEKSRHELSVYKNLLKKNAVSAMEYQRKELEHLKTEAELNRIKEDYAKLAAGLAAKIIVKAQSELNLLKLQLEGKRKELELCKLHLSDYVFVAPEDGIVSDIPLKPGGFVEPGEVLVKFSSTGRKKFTAYIDEEHIYKVREKQPVRLISSQYNYLDYGYFHGIVDDIGELPEQRGSRNMYPVRIILTKEPQPVRLSSTGEAWIITGRERIIYVLSGWR